MTTKTLKDKFKQEITAQLIDTFDISNVNASPKLEKIVINRGFGKESVASKNVINITVDQFVAITGQQPILTKAKKAISNFKLRKDQIIGCKVTLRSEKMWDFLSKLVYIVLPKIKDFRGVPRNSFDGRGNYTLSIKEDAIFPEIKDSDKIRGLDITFVTSSTTTDEQSFHLLESLGIKFRSK